MRTLNSAWPMAVVVLLLPAAQSQEQRPASTRPQFEVASVKPSAPVPPNGGVYFGPPRGGPGTPDPGLITWTYARLRDLRFKPTDHPDSLAVPPAPEQESGETVRLVRRVEITVEREITTVIRRVAKAPSEPGTRRIRLKMSQEADQ